MIVPKLYLNDKNYSNPSKSIVQARNVMLNDDFAYITNEKGFTKLHTFVNSICGVIDTPDYDIVFCTNDDTLSEIYKVNDSTKELVIQGNLGFSTSNPIKGIYQNNSLGELIVVWNDTVNPLGAINIDNPPLELNPDKTIVNLEDIIKLKLSLDCDIPNFSLDVRNGGTLPKGKYQIVTTYILSEYDTTAWSLPSYVVPVGLIRNTKLRYSCESSEGIDSNTTYDYTDKYQSDDEANTNKYLHVTVRDLDSRYEGIRVAIVHITNTSTTLYNIGDFDISNKTSLELDVTTLPSNQLSLDEVTIPYVTYDRYNDICNHEGTLYTGGVFNSTTYEYQKYANNIEVKYGVNIMHSHDDVLNNIFNVTVTPDEVYAFVINLIGLDGNVKGVYHIPGRAPLDGETRLLDSNEIYDISDTAKYVYQRDNTADRIGDIRGRLAYWENENEKYPVDLDYEIYDVNASGEGFKIGSLIGEKVRHHKMPDFDKLYNVPLITTNLYTDKTVKNIQLQFNNIKFPKEILDNIQGYSIGYIKRSSEDMTVMGHFPLLHNKFWLSHTDRSSYSQFGIPTEYEGVERWGHRFNDINLIKNTPSISNPYIKGLYITELPDRNTLDIDCTIISEFDNRIIKVNDYKYIPNDNYASNPINKGREATLMLELDEKEYTPYFNQSILTTVLKSNKSDVYTNVANKRIALASNIYRVTEGIYEYNTAHISHFDSYNNVYYTNLYKGDATLEGSPADGYSRPNIEVMKIGTDEIIANDTNIMTSFKVVSYSTMDIDFKSRIDINTDIDYYRPSVFRESDKYKVEANFNVDPAKDDGVIYDNTYSRVNDIKALYVTDNIKARIKSFPYRVARSLQQSKESLNLNWRYFPALDYYENVKYRGEITGITSADNILLIHHEHSLYIAKIKNRLKTDGQDAYIGAADLFEYRPEEFLPTNAGKAGLQSRFGKVVGEQGYVFVDTYESSVYVYNNKGFSIITNDDVKLFLRKYLNNNSSGNPLTSNDIILGLDEKNDRLLLTNKGDNNLTLSYCYNTNITSWISLHDYIPSLMFNNRRGSYNVSSDLKSIYKIDDNYDNIGLYHSTIKQESFIDVLLNDSSHISKELISLGIQSGVSDESNNINKLFVYTKNQCSNIITLEEFNDIEDWDKLRYIENYWLYDVIRDYTSNAISQNIVNDFGDIEEDAIFLDKSWFELSSIIDRAFIIRLISTNNNRAIFRDVIYNVTVNSR